MNILKEYQRKRGRPIVTAYLFYLLLFPFFAIAQDTPAAKTGLSDSIKYKHGQYQRVKQRRLNLTRLDPGAEKELNDKIKFGDIRGEKGIAKFKNKYFFADKTGIYMFKPRDWENKPKEKLSLVSELIAGRLAYLFGLRNNIVYDYQAVINGKKTYGTLQYYYQDYRPFTLDDFKYLSNDGLSMMMEEYVLDLFMTNSDVDVHNVIINKNDPHDFKVVGREELFILFSSYGYANPLYARNYFYEDIFSLYRSGIVAIDLKVGESFARYIQECPDGYIIEIVKPILKKYNIKPGALECLLERKNNLLKIYNDSLLKDIQSVPTVSSFEELIEW